jgi:hypothetical protein
MVEGGESFVPPMENNAWLELIAHALHREDLRSTGNQLALRELKQTQRRMLATKIDDW